MNILFVCTGNTCRSPMAEGYLKSKKLSGITVLSRGLFADGSKVSENSKIAMLDKGIDIGGHISKQITALDIEKSDKIICLSDSHMNMLMGLGVDKDKLSVLGDGIPDPFGGDIEIYNACRDKIFEAIDILIKNGFFNSLEILSLDRKYIKKIAELEKICFSEPWSENVILENCETGTKFFVAELSGKFTGYIGIKPVLDEGYITNIAVLPEFRKKGIATALLNSVFSLADEHELSFVSLEVRVSNTEAVSLYEKLGFKVEGRRKNFYRSPNEDAYIMTKRFQYENS